MRDAIFSILVKIVWAILSYLAWIDHTWSDSCVRFDFFKSNLLMIFHVFFW